MLAIALAQPVQRYVLMVSTSRVITTSLPGVVPSPVEQTATMSLAALGLGGTPPAAAHRIAIAFPLEGGY